MEQRFIVDIMSDAHQRAITNNLSYVEGVVYNDISYMIERYGKCHVDDLPNFLHINEKSVENAVSTLVSKKLIRNEDGELFINYYSLEELREDPIVGTMIMMMEELIKQAQQNC